MRNHSTNDEAKAGLKSHFPKLTKAQIAKVMIKWYKQMEAA
jgi:hypothetical protein